MASAAAVVRVSPARDGRAGRRRSAVRLSGRLPADDADRGRSGEAAVRRLGVGADLAAAGVSEPAAGRAAAAWGFSSERHVGGCLLVIRLAPGGNAGAARP